MQVAIIYILMMHVTHTFTNILYQQHIKFNMNIYKTQQHFQ